MRAFQRVAVPVSVVALSALGMSGSTWAVAGNLSALLSTNSPILTFPATACVNVRLTRTDTGAPVAGDVLFNVTRMTAGGVNGAGPPLADPHPTFNILGSTDANGNGSACFSPTDIGRWDWGAIYANAGADTGLVNGNVVSQTLVPAAIADARIDTTVAMDATSVVLGDTVGVTYTIVNDGQLAASGFNWIASDLTGTSEYVSATPSQGSCSGSLVCNFGVIAPAGRVTVSAELRARSLGTIQLDAGMIQWPLGAPPSPPNLRSSEGKATITVVPRSVDLSVSIVISPQTIKRRGLARAVVTIRNAGPDTATDPILTVQASNLADHIGVIASGSRCDPKGETCALSPLAAGATSLFQLVVRTNLPGRHRVVARISSASATDPVAANNVATATVATRRRNHR